MKKPGTNLGGVTSKPQLPRGQRAGHLVEGGVGGEQGQEEEKGETGKKHGGRQVQAEEGRRMASAQKTCLLQVEGARLNFLLRDSRETDPVWDRRELDRLTPGLGVEWGQQPRPPSFTWAKRTSLLCAGKAGPAPH